MTEIELQNISKTYGDVVAVDDVSLLVEDEELVVLVGPSGSGKSTTLRMIAGLERPTEGEIFIGGERVTDVAPQHRDVAMVFQSFALYPHRTVRGNLAFPLEARGRPRAEIDDRVEAVAETLNIPELLDRKPSQLSGGQQQRVALGRAMVRDPQAFLMDEPLANLDAKLRKEMRVEVVRLQQELATTMIHVTHNQEEAMTMGDRIVVMREGKLQQVAPPKEAYRRPVNRFVAEFIGSPSMNFIEGTVEDGRFTASDAGVSFQLDGGLAAAADGRTVTAGIRPENLELVESPGDHTITATVDVVELLGNVQIVYFEVDGREFLAEVDPDLALEGGEEAVLRFDPGKLHLFDGTTPDSERLAPAD